MNKHKGFTIVELLIVIVIIAILASITIVVFSGAQARARDNARYAELVQVDRLFQLYRIQNGNYPAIDMTPGKMYCVGAGFPSGDCWDGVSEADQTVTNALKTVGNVPNGSKAITNFGTHVWVIDSTSFELNGVSEDHTCPKNFEQTEIYPGHVQCIKIYRINDPL